VTSTTSPGAATGELPAPSSSAALVTERGHTTIAPLVAEKIAARAASEVDGVGGVVRTGLSRLLPFTSGAGPASADAAVDGGTVAVDLTVNVLYPRPVGTVTAQVRDRVVTQLAQLCGLEARPVNIVVPELVRPTGVTRRRVE